MNNGKYIPSKNYKLLRKEHFNKNYSFFLLIKQTLIKI